MARTRELAVEHARAGTLSICQGGAPVDPEDFRGPIRLRLCVHPD